MSKSNYVSLYGTLIKDAVIKTNDKGNEYALFTLSVPQDGTKWCDYINCIAFGACAVAAVLEVDEQCIVAVISVIDAERPLAQCASLRRAFAPCGAEVHAVVSRRAVAVAFGIVIHPVVDNLIFQTSFVRSAEMTENPGSLLQNTVPSVRSTWRASEAAELTT